MLNFYFDFDPYRSLSMRWDVKAFFIKSSSGPITGWRSCFPGGFFRVFPYRGFPPDTKTGRFGVKRPVFGACCGPSNKEPCNCGYNLLDDGLCGVDAKVKIQFISPGVPGIDLIILGTLLIDSGNLLFQFLIGQLFVLRTLFPAALDFAFHVRIDKDPERPVFLQNIIRTPPHDHAIGFV